MIEIVIRKIKIQEEKKEKRINNVEEMMKSRIDKISTKHERIEKKVNEINEEKKQRS